MTELEKLEEELHTEYGLTIDYKRVANRDGIIITEEGQTPYIAVDKRLEDRRRTAVAYHEAGHLKRGITRRTRRDELRAERWAMKRLITLDTLIEGIKRYPRSLHELADCMNVDEDMLRNYLTYKGNTRLYQEHGDYIISFDPVILLNWKTCQIWPED